MAKQLAGRLEAPCSRRSKKSSYSSSRTDAGEWRSASFDEMKDALDLKSKSGIHRLITALVERGFIRRLPHRARAIEVIKLSGQHGFGGRASADRLYAECD